MAAIEFEHVSKRYRRGVARRGLRDAIPEWLRRASAKVRSESSGSEYIWALRDVSFSVDRGETLGIIGRNGAGKTTILKLLSNITKPTSGAARVNGRTSALIELGAGFHPDLTGRENIYLNASILGLEKRYVDHRFDSIVHFAELEEFIDTPVKHYSSGMYVRLGFAVAVHTDPEVLLVDEVLAVGDLAFQRKCFQQMRRLRDSGVTIVLISHNIYQIQRMCPRAILIDRGSLVADGHSQEVASLYLQSTVGGALNEQEAGAGGTHMVASPDVQTSDEVALTGITILDKSGQETDTISACDPMTVRLGFCASERISEPIVGVAFYTLDRVGISGSSNAFRNERTALDGDCAVECHISQVTLLPGVYSLKVRVVGRDGRIILDAPDVHRFRVVSESSEFTLANYGLVYMESKWHAPEYRAGKCDPC